MDRHDLRLIYGVGLLTREVPLSGIQSNAIVRNEALSAFIYRPLGENLLMLTLRNGKKFAVPSRKAKQLASAISVKGTRNFT